jgi:hypothetical protein
MDQEATLNLRRISLRGLEIQEDVGYRGGAVAIIRDYVGRRNRARLNSLRYLVANASQRGQVSLLCFVRRITMMAIADAQRLSACHHTLAG